MLVLNSAVRALGFPGVTVQHVFQSASKSVRTVADAALQREGFTRRHLDGMPVADAQEALKAAAERLVREMQGRERIPGVRFAAGGPIDVGRGPIVPIDGTCSYMIPTSAAGGVDALKALNDMTLDTCAVDQGELERLRDENAELHVRVQELTGERDAALAELAQFRGGVVVINDRLDDVLGGAR